MDIQKEFEEQLELIDDARKSYDPDDDTTIGFLRKSNAQYEEWTRPTVAYLGKVKRWSETSIIQVCSEGDERARLALELFEKAFDRKIFLRIRNAEHVRGLGRGIIFSIGTAEPKPEKPIAACKGGVSHDENLKSTPYELVCLKSGAFEGIARVNLDCSVAGGGTADLAVTLHELGHAMGLGEHFCGFCDDGPPVSKTFWHVLWKLYELPVGHAM